MRPRTDKPAIRWCALLLLSAFGCGDDADCGVVCPPGEQCLVISEFSAAGQDTLQDEDGDSPDWIELHNRTDRRVQAVGHFLTDDPLDSRKWRLPDCSVEPGGFLVVFASGKNRPGHANFTLDEAGEYLALIREDGATVEAEFASAPTQVPGVSYGLRFVDGRATDSDAFFPTPTPGAPNGEGVDELGQPVRFEPSSRAFFPSVDIALSSGEGAGEIRYTLDGSMPDERSTLFAEAVRLTETTTLRARTFAAGIPGAVTSATYIALDAETAAFESNLPVVIVRANEVLDRGDLRPAAAIVIDRGDEGLTRLTDTPQHASRAGMRIRGSSSFYFDKQQYNLELQNESGGDQDASLLGMPADSDWILHAPWSDKTLMRNHLMYGWFRAAGRYAPRTRFVEVFFEAPEEGVPLGPRMTSAHYAGVYVLIEKIKRSPDRVDIERLRPSDATPEAISGGYIVARDRVDEDDQGFLTPSGALIAISEPNESVLTPAQRAYIADYFEDLEETFESSDWRERYEEDISVPAFIDHHLFVEFGRNADGLRLSTFMVKDRGEPLALGPIWDCNLCLGNAATFSAWKREGWHHAPIGAELPSSWDCECGNQDTAFPLPPDQNTDCGEGCWPVWFETVFQDPEFVERYRARWAALRSGPLADTELLAAIDAAAAELEQAQARNFERWDLLGVRVWGNTFVGATWQEEVLYMREWVIARAAWMDAQLLD